MESKIKRTYLSLYLTIQSRLTIDNCSNKVIVSHISRLCWLVSLLCCYSLGTLMANNNFRGLLYSDSLLSYKHKQCQYSYCTKNILFRTEQVDEYTKNKTKYWNLNESWADICRLSLLELLSELNNLQWYLISWQSLICLSSCPRLSNDTINIMYNVKFKEHNNVHQDNPQNLLPLHDNNYKVDNVENEENTW